MGREAEGHCRWNGKEGWTKAFLESSELILRAEIKARLPRPSLSDWRVDGDTLVLRADGGLLEIDLGAAEAARWVAALSRPLPSLAQKFGLAADTRGFVIGHQDLPELTQALDGTQAATLDSASMLIAILRSASDLSGALATARRYVALPVWFVHQKGKSAAVTDTQIRATMRGAGYMDIKTSAVTADWTASKYAAKRT
jgi:hypothetical protein